MFTGTHTDRHTDAHEHHNKPRPAELAGFNEGLPCPGNIVCQPLDARDSNGQTLYLHPNIGSSTAVINILRGSDFVRFC